MKTLVTFFSKTGNTEKVAKTIAQAIESEIDLKPVEGVESAEEYDVIFCGFPVHAHSVPMPVQHLIKSLPAGKKIALFTTHGSLRGGELAITAIEHAVSLTSKLTLLGTFGCRGKVNPKVLEALEKQPEHKAWAQMAQSAAGHPDEADLEDGRDFAKKMMAKASIT